MMERKKNIQKVIIFSFILLFLCLFINNNDLDDLSSNGSTFDNNALKSSSPIWSFNAEGDVKEVAMSSNGSYIIASKINTIFLLNKSNSNPIWSYNTGDDIVDLAISADGQYFVVGNEQSKIYFFDRGNSTPLWTYNIGGNLFSVDISSNGNYITATRGDKIYLFEKASSTPLWINETANAGMVAISPNGEYVVGVGDFVYLFNTSNSLPIWTYNMTGKGVIRQISISTDNNYIALVAGGYTKKLLLFVRDSSTPLWIEDLVYGPKSLAISSDGSRIVVGTQGVFAGSLQGFIYLFDGTSFTSIWSYETGGHVNSVAMSSNGDFIIAGSGDKNIYLFNKSISTPIWSYKTGGAVNSVAMSSNGTYFIAGSSDHHLYFFNIKHLATPQDTDFILFMIIFLPIIIGMACISSLLIIRKKKITRLVEDTEIETIDVSSKVIEKDLKKREIIEKDWINIPLRYVSGTLLIVGGIVLLTLSNIFPWAYGREANCWESGGYIYCFGLRPNYDAPVNGLPFIILTIFGAVILNITLIARTRLPPFSSRIVSIFGLLLGSILLIIPAFLIALSYFPETGFYIYLLSLIPIIAAYKLLKISKERVTQWNERKQKKMIQYICPKCGAKLFPGHNNCLECGDKIQFEE